MSLLERLESHIPSENYSEPLSPLPKNPPQDYIALMKKRRQPNRKAQRRKVRSRAKRIRKIRRQRGILGWLRRWFRRLFLAAVFAGIAIVLIVASFRWINPPVNITMAQEYWRLGRIERQWVPLAEISLHAPRAAIAAEDANFCRHWGFDIAAIRLALAGGARRGGSTISQQTAKNVFLWQQRSWIRKGLEAGFTLLIEAFWDKRRIVEVYLNIAEFDEGVFGIEAAARHYFGKSAKSLSLRESSRLMAVLPSPKTRSASRPTAFVRRRASSIAAGAETIRGDDRTACLNRPKG